MFNLKIGDVKFMMRNKDYIVFNILKRCEYEIQAAALKGMSGFIFYYPKKYQDYLEVNYLIDSLIDGGFTVTDEEGTDEDAALGIYWAVD